MLATPSNPLLPGCSFSLNSSPSPTSPKPKIGFALNSKSGFCRTVKRVSSAHSNLGRKGNSCYNYVIYSNCLKISHWPDPYLAFLLSTRVVPTSKSRLEFCNGGELSPRRCIDFRSCGRLVRVGCGSSGIEDDAYYMRRAVECAREAIGHTSPNPMVGCVIVKDGEIVGEGFHPKAGQPHAEVFALRNAGELAEGGTAYVSLEPCNHYGRTPPCTEALIKAKVSKVVVGMVDPNPIVASKGVDRLRDAGIEVIVGVEEELCKKLNEGYIHKMLSGKPFVTLRYSISVNGLLDYQLGEGASDCGGYYSKLLQENDALIQSSNALSNFGFPTSKEPKATQPCHVVIARKTNSSILIPDLPPESTHNAIVFAEDGGDVVLGAAQKGIEKVAADKISLEAILDYCGKQGSCSVLLDVRGSVAGLEEILEEGWRKSLLQKVVVEVLPVWGGGEECIGSPLTRVTQRLRLKNLSTTVSGGSVLLEGYF